MQIFPYIAVGLALILLLWDFFRQSRAPKSNSFALRDEPLSEAGLSPEFTSLIFGAADAQFVAGQGSRELTRLFARQRKEIAAAWLRCVRADAAALMRFHRAAARTSKHLEPLVELRLAWTYFAYIAYCNFLGILVRLRGPVRLQQMANYADSQSECLHELVGRVLPVHLSGDRHDIDLHPSGGTSL
jgi:hypothetical protein